MSESIGRRNSSRQLLQNLIRVTAQRSQEDAEEVERERRRRAREKERGEGNPSWPEPPRHHNLTHSTESDEELKPSCRLVLEEDEGFSDWSHRLENRNEQEVQDSCRTRQQRRSAPPVPEEEEEEEEKKQQEEEEEQGEGGKPERSRRWSQEASPRPPEKTSGSKKECRTSYSSSVFLPQDARLKHAAGRPADRTSYLVAGTMRPRRAACRVDGEVEQEVQKEEEEEEKEDEEKEEEKVKPTLQKEQRSAETQQTLGDEEDQEEEELSFTREEKEVLHLRREQKHQEEEEEEEEEEMQNKKMDLSHERPLSPLIADDGVRMQERSMESGGGRREEANRRSAASLCSSEGEEPLNCYGPMSPTFKKLLIQFYPDEVSGRVSTDGKCTITERTESLRRSTGNIKKTQQPVPVSKIDRRLEQYTHALEVSSKEGRSGCQVLTDLTSPTEPVASKKNLFEAGEAWNQNATSVAPSKEIKPGGVLNKKNLWESLGDTFSSGREGKESSTGKRYKFVVAGHGKYEKVSVDDGCSEDGSCQSAGQYYEDL